MQHWQLIRRNAEGRWGYFHIYTDGRVKYGRGPARIWTGPFANRLLRRFS